MDETLNITSKTTEQRNPRSEFIDSQEVSDILKLINTEDQSVPLAVARVLTDIEAFIVKLVPRLMRSGRLIYVGSGTSGRLGVLDAVECPPTFSVDRRMVQGIIAGGSEALVRSIEGAEDDTDEGRRQIRNVKVGPDDAVLGIASSGTTPFVHAAVQSAYELGALTGLLICNESPPLDYVDVVIKVIVGPEIITGSTRMKAGTATKLVLNMITTTAMIKLNKTYGNLMVDLQAMNQKLWDRGTRIIHEFTGLKNSAARQLLNQTNGEVKTAIVMGIQKVGAAEARKLLLNVNGSLRQVID